MYKLQHGCYGNNLVICVRFKNDVAGDSFWYFIYQLQSFDDLEVRKTIAESVKAKCHLKFIVIRFLFSVHRSFVLSFSLVYDRGVCVCVWERGGVGWGGCVCRVCMYVGCGVCTGCFAFSSQRRQPSELIGLVIFPFILLAVHVQRKKKVSEWICKSVNNESRSTNINVARGQSLQNVEVYYWCEFDIV